MSNEEKLSWYSRVMGVRRASLVDVRSRGQALHNGSRVVPCRRRILGCRYSVVVALAHFGQIPPMGIHILTLLRFSLAYHPFHTRCDTPSLFLLLPSFSFSLCRAFLDSLPRTFVGHRWVNAMKTTTRNTRVIVARNAKHCTWIR